MTGETQPATVQKKGDVRDLIEKGATSVEVERDGKKREIKVGSNMNVNQ